MTRYSRFGLAVGFAAIAMASVANAQVRRPSGAHAFFNFIPFGGSGQVCTQHQVFDASLWSGPMEITALGFAANDSLNGQSYDSDIIVRLGYTNKIPGVDTGSGGLDVILANNPSSAMTTVFNSNVSTTIVGTGTEDFSFILQFDSGFCYDPSQGNLLVELFSSYNSGADLSVSRTGGSAESSRAYNSTRFGDAASPTTATRMDFYEGSCSGGGGTITFDELGSQPCTFSSTQPLTTEYQASKRVVFAGPEPGQGGAILDECSNFGVDARSGANFLAFNTSGYAVTPETITFLDGASRVEIYASPGSQSGSVTLTARDARNNVVDVSTLTMRSGAYVRLEVSGNIATVVVTTTSPWLLLEDLSWDGQGGGFTLDVSGRCPGLVTVNWSGAQPNATVALIFARNTGSFVIPFGPCQGTVLGLGNQGIRLVNTFPSGLNGSGSRTGNAGSAACRGFLQMHDIPNCDLSNVAQLP